MKTQAIIFEQQIIFNFLAKNSITINIIYYYNLTPFSVISPITVRKHPAIRPTCKAGFLEAEGTHRPIIHVYNRSSATILLWAFYKIFTPNTDITGQLPFFQHNTPQNIGLTQFSYICVDSWYIFGQPFVVVFRFSYFFYFQDHYAMSSRLKWTTQEEELLKSLGCSTQKNKWTHIAKLINDQLPEIQRTPKQCRQKYNNHLIFGDRSYDANWSQLEDEKLFNEYKEKGPRWKIISESFPTKSQNTIKNRFYGNVRKIVRKLNKIGKEKISKSFKPIRQKSIIRIIEPDAGLIELSENVLQQMKGLRQKLIQIIKIGIEQNQPQEIQRLEDYIQLIKQIHSFNCKCRFLRNFKPRSHRRFSKMSKENENIKSTEANFEESEQSSQELNQQNSRSNSESNSSRPLSEGQGINNKQKKQKQVIGAQKLDIDVKNMKKEKNPGKIEKMKSGLAQRSQKRVNSIHIINLIHQYVVEYCFGKDKQCYGLLVSKQQ